jgi:hypothetical protein
MKKMLLLSSIILVGIWITGFFIFRFPPAIHILLALSVLVYVRSLLHAAETPTQKYYRAKSRKTN